MPKMDGISKPTNNVAVLTEASRLHELGLWVVPCDGKKPLLKGWDERRLYYAELRRFLSGSHLNIAIALHKSDLIDVECDSDEAEATLDELFAGDIPPTPTWRSKRGLHRLFRRPNDLPDKAKIEIDGVEFRGIGSKGALSIVPPSKHPDGPHYEWLPGLSLDQVEPAELPPQVVERLRAAVVPPSAEPTGEGDIPEGKRNDELFKIACKLVRAKIPATSVLFTLRAENQSRCKPPLLDSELIAIAKSASSQSSQSSQNTASLLIEIALKDAELWHTPEEVAFATIRRDGHQEHWPIRKKVYRQWLAKQFYDREKTPPNSQALQDAINTLEGKAKFDGKEYPVFVRVAGYENRVYIDMADEQWRVIEVDSKGWRIITEAPVRFRRHQRMLPLPIPKRGGSIQELRRFANVSDDGPEWCLLLAFILDCFRPSGPRTILKVAAEQGGGKTTVTKLIRGLVDPNTCSSRGTPTGERDLRIAAESGWVCAFDNLSYLTPDLSDALCRLSSGGGFGVRTHYEDEDETVFSGKRPIVLNGIEEVGTRSDLSDRSVVIQLPRIADEDRVSEEVFDQQFAEARPAILGGLLDAVVVALRKLPSVRQSHPVGGWPRMIDFAQWVVAAEPALGFKEGEFLETYRASRAAANAVALESCPVVRALKEMLKTDRKFTGTAGELFDWCKDRGDHKAKGFPGNARALSGILRRQAPNLREEGWEVEEPNPKRNRKLWTIKLPPVEESASSQSSQIPKASLKGESGGVRRGAFTLDDIAKRAFG